MLVTIFENRGCLLLIVFKWGAVVVNGLEKIGPEKAVSHWVFCSGLEKAVFLWLLWGHTVFVNFFDVGGIYLQCLC